MHRSIRVITGSSCHDIFAGNSEIARIIGGGIRAHWYTAKQT